MEKAESQSSQRPRRDVRLIRHPMRNLDLSFRHDLPQPSICRLLQDQPVGGGRILLVERDECWLRHWRGPPSNLRCGLFATTLVSGKPLGGHCDILRVPCPERTDTLQAKVWELRVTAAHRTSDCGRTNKPCFYRETLLNIPLLNLTKLLSLEGTHED